MDQELIHVYFVPGLAASKEIFKNIKLPANRFKVHIIDWVIPKRKETMYAYAKRMAAFVDHKDAVLIGVSFGGVVVQEMSHFLELRKLIIISSVKSRKELPRRLKIARATGIYRLMPTRLVLSAKDLTKFSVGPRSKKRLQLYQAFLHVRNKRYLDWAIKHMVCWNRKLPDNKVVHIHGDADVIFPIKNINSYTLVEGGTHIMLLNKGSQVSKKIIEAIDA